MERKQKAFTLPAGVIGPVDIGRLNREMDAINETMLQLKLRKSGDEVKLPNTSRLLDQTIELNGLNLLKEEDRLQLSNSLKTIEAKAPVVHMSFSADPSAAFLERITQWFRTEVNPYTLITVGLQPNLGAGCIMRTTNKYFDLSLKESFNDKRDMLVEKLFPPELLSQSRNTQPALEGAA
ncbi:MAG TPA: hypothetical protein VFN51_00190 [Candidatus Saccharimonadales bacterium]|nr:hypothetical protein [Candidatus Saccharimonadales bacterium]